MFKILWVDDEYYKQEAFIDYAYLRGLKLCPFKSFKDGINEIERHFEEYQGIILDAKAYNESENEVASAEGLPKAINKLHEMRPKGGIPIYVFTGQPDLFSSDIFEMMLGDVKCYKKGLEIDLLLDDVLKNAQNLAEIQIRNKYLRVFEACTEKYIGESAAYTLIEAIKSIEVDNSPISYKDSFNPLRKLTEVLFSKLNSLKIIPDEISNGAGWINKSSLFLAGKHDRFSIKEGVIHPVIISSIYSFLQITQDASHEIPEKLNLKVGQYVDEMKTPYLYQSTLYQLFDILIWFKHFIDDHPDPEQNKKLWSEIVQKSPPDEIWIQGEVLHIASNGWGTFRPDTSEKTISILPAIVKQFNLQEKDRIEITTKPDPTGTKTYIDQIRRLPL